MTNWPKESKSPRWHYTYGFEETDDDEEDKEDGGAEDEVGPSGDGNRARSSGVGDGMGTSSGDLGDKQGYLGLLDWEVFLTLILEQCFYISCISIAMRTSSFYLVYLL
ncbi:hypothetical protein ACH5RR_036869 [Cinchona calisaya]|uniref:Uncharacterized protein n=1 Tax=Cinchona calisaya TaxID=153742 RepID=A0ABD2Y9D2_9GENT